MRLHYLPGLWVALALPLHAQEAAPASAAKPSAESSTVKLTRWITNLSHPSLAVREIATAQLIEGGPAAAQRIKALCHSEDPALALRARRIFGGVFGVTPEAYDHAMGWIAAVAEDRSKPAEAAAAVREAGAAATLFALERTKPEEDHRPSALHAELVVQSSLQAICAGADREDKCHEAVLALSTQATAPLKRALRDSKLDAGQRTHAVWLYSLVAGGDRTSGLAPLLRDAHASVRREATLAIVEAVRPDDFDALADAVGSGASAERTLLVQALARCMDSDTLETSLGDSANPRAALAALVLGCRRDEKALEALAKAVERTRPEPVTAAIVTALGEFEDEKASTALASVYANAREPGVRAAVVAALRPRAEHRLARACLTTALFDADQTVRLQATDALAGLTEASLAPALIQAAEADSSDALRARALSTLEQLVPDASGALRSDRAGTLETWKTWLANCGGDYQKKSLPWFRASREAGRVVRQIRELIEQNFFHFGKEELIDPDKLNAVAIEAMRATLREKDTLKLKGRERELLARLLGHGAVDTPEALLEALGSIPFEAGSSDLVRLTDAALNGFTQHLGDRFSAVRASNDAEGKIRPEWVPGLVDGNDVTNGFYAQKKGDLVVIDFVLFDSPAWYAGFRSGDQLIKVGDKIATELKKRELGKELQKENKFTVLRDGWLRPHTFELKPTKASATHIVTKAVLPGKIGYVRLKMFDLGCSVKIEKALKQLERENIRGVILDLRNNPGGTVADAVAIVDKFLPAGKMITVNETRTAEENTGGTVEEEIKSKDQNSDRTYPVAVLINRSSASASEMTSGSLQGNARATVVGEKSFGKGIGQVGYGVTGFSSETALGESSSVYGLTLTMMRYYLPEGKRSIHGIGVEPDISVRERNLRASLFEKVMRVRRGKPFEAYLAKLHEDHADALPALAIFDGGDTSGYPDFDAFYKKVARHVSEDQARRLVREALRVDLMAAADEKSFDQYCYDLQDDRALRAAIVDVAEKAEIELDKVPEYSSW